MKDNKSKPITKDQYKSALKIVSDYEKQVKETESKPKICNHYFAEWVAEEQRYVCPDCGYKGEIYIKK